MLSGRMALPENLLVPQDRDRFIEFTYDTMTIFLQKNLFHGNKKKISFKIPYEDRYFIELVSDDVLRII